MSRRGGGAGGEGEATRAERSGGPPENALHGRLPPRPARPSKALLDRVSRPSPIAGWHPCYGATFRGSVVQITGLGELRFRRVAADITVASKRDRAVRGYEIPRNAAVRALMHPNAPRPELHSRADACSGRSAAPGRGRVKTPRSGTKLGKMRSPRPHGLLSHEAIRRG